VCIASRQLAVGSAYNAEDKLRLKSSNYGSSESEAHKYEITMREYQLRGKSAKIPHILTIFAG
jgi:hypothetical protein